MAVEVVLSGPQDRIHDSNGYMEPSRERRESRGYTYIRSQSNTVRAVLLSATMTKTRYNTFNIVSCFIRNTHANQ